MGHAWSKALSLACPTDDIDVAAPSVFSGLAASQVAPLG